MPVFISHRTLDDSIALAVYQRLTGVHRIKCYIDNLDTFQDTQSLTSRIVTRLNECTNLLAIVTKTRRAHGGCPLRSASLAKRPEASRHSPTWRRRRSQNT